MNECALVCLTIKLLKSRLLFQPLYAISADLMVQIALDFIGGHSAYGICIAVHVINRASALIASEIIYWIS